jgi:Putative metallopeptidase
MMRAFRLLCVLTLAAAGAIPVLDGAAAAPKVKPNQIKIQYVAPKNPAHQPIYDRLKQGRFLEKAQEFLSPFRLPRPLLMKTEGCDGESNAWYENDAITLCYEYIEEMWRNAPTETTPDGITPVDALVAPVFDTVLHEFGHAIFEILKIPVFGREEDGADQVAAYIALQLGKDQARRQIAGVAYAYMTEAKAEAKTTPKLERFANEHGTPAQRFYNLLCIAYGAKPEVFADLRERYLPKDRAEGCEEEYKQVAFAFESLIGPHIDRALARSVMEKTWLPDVNTRLLRRPRSSGWKWF